MYRANIQRTGIYQTKGLRNLTGIKWKLQINFEPEITGLQVGLNFPLAIRDGVVYLCNKGYLYAVYSKTGEEIWKIQIDNARLDNSILYKNIVYVSSSDGSLYAVNVETQQIKWKSPINFIRHCNPVIYDDVIFVNSTDGNFYALYAEDGREKWRFKTTKDMSVTPPALSNGIIYIASENGNVYAIDINTGQEKWKCEVGKLRWLFSVPVVANNVVYVGVENSILYAIDAEGGTGIWQSQVEAKYYLSPLCPLVVNDEFIYIGVGIGSLCAINIENLQK